MALLSDISKQYLRCAAVSVGNIHKTWIFKKCLGAAHFPVDDTAASLQSPWQPAQQHALPLSHFPPETEAGVTHRIHLDTRTKSNKPCVSPYAAMAFYFLRQTDDPTELITITDSKTNTCFAGKLHPNLAWKVPLFSRS